MPESRYVYSTVRVVPNPATGEFANLAAIAGSDESGDWSIRSIPNQRRARMFCGHHAMMAGQDFVSRIGLTMDLAAWASDEDGDDDAVGMDGPEAQTFEHVSETWLRDLADRQRHTVQLSRPKPILAESADEALDFVFDHVFLEPRHRQQTLNKRGLLTSMKANYSKAGLTSGTDFAWHAPLVAAGPHRYTHPLDYVVRDSSVLQIVQMWSFQVGAQTDLARDVKAWGWTMREMREHGGSVLIDGKHVAIGDSVDVNVVVAPPVNAIDARRYDEALAVFEEFEANVVQHGNEAQVAERAASLLGTLGNGDGSA